MPIDIHMPQLSPTMTEGRLATWRVKEGDEVSSGDIIAEVETDKATMEVEASDDGVVYKIIGKAGTDIRVGTPIAILRDEDEKVAKNYEPTSQVVEEEVVEESTEAEADSTNKASPVAVASGIAVAAKLAPDLPEVKAVNRTEDGQRVSATPVAKRLAEKEGLDLSSVKGSGPYGRITKEDVESALGTGKVARSADAKEVHTPMRKAIGKRLLESKQQTPHFYLTSSVNMDTLLEARKQVNAMANGAYKLTVNDFILKACAMALAKNPNANVSFYDDAMVHYGNVDISVAVAIEGGLITPIVKNADKKSMQQISAEVKSLATRAKAGELKPEEYEGGTFSLSNLGMFGVKEFKAIVNPPQSAILAVGASEERVVAKNGQMMISSVMDISLSCDHRAIDGALGAELLRDIKFFLENPIAMLAV